GDARHCHHVLDAQLFFQLGREFFGIELFKPCHFFHLTYASTASPLDLKTRILVPSSSTLKPTRSAFWVLGLKMATLEAWIAASFSTMPPATPSCGFGF